MPLALCLVALVSLGFPFVSVTYESRPPLGPGSLGLRYEDSARFLGRSTGIAGADSIGGGNVMLPGTSLTEPEAVELLESVSAPLALVVLVQVGVVLCFVGLIRNRLGAMLAFLGALLALAVTMWMRLAIASQGTEAAAQLGQGFRVAFGPGSILMPVSLGLNLVWNAVRLRVAPIGREPTTSPIAGTEDLLARSTEETPLVVRGVGWYLLISVALGVLFLVGSERAGDAAELSWRVPMLLVTTAVGLGLVLGRRWAYPIGIGLGLLQAAVFLVAQVAFWVETPRAGILLIPALLSAAIVVVPVILLFRPDARAWFFRRRAPAPG